MGARRRARRLTVGRVAYERDLAVELTKLEAEFGRWRAGQLSAHDLSDRVHVFHQGPARELFGKYDRSNLDFAVAHAIQRGLITEEEAGSDVIDALQVHLAFLRAEEDDHDKGPPNLAPESDDHLGPSSPLGATIAIDVGKMEESDGEH